MTDRPATTTLSIRLTCRDGREAEHEGRRGGRRLAEAVLTICPEAGIGGVALRGINCMSQCKRPCVVALGAPGKTSYPFGDLDLACDAPAELRERAVRRVARGGAGRPARWHGVALGSGEARLQPREPAHLGAPGRGRAERHGHARRG